MATNAIIEKVTGTDSSSNRIASTFYCTCSTAAATAQKEATPADSCVFNDACLITGVTVFVSFTYTNTASTPTLKVGTSTAKQIMAYGTTKIGTSTTKSWYAGSVVSFTYNGTYWIQNDYKYDTDSNTYDRNRYQVNIKAGTTAITAGNIIVANSSNLYHHLKDGTAFDIKNPILYANGDIAASSTGTNNYDIINFTVTTTQSITLTAYAPVFIKGTLAGTTFTPDSTSPLTQTIPTSADSKYYMLLGVANSTTAIYLTEDHRIFAYKNGAFGEIVNAALSVNGYTVAKSVPSDAVFTDTTYTGTGAISVNATTHVISTTAQANVQSDWNATSGDAFIKNKPTIPTVNDATLTIQKNGTTVKTFTANASSNVTCNINVPTATSDLTNDSSFCAINDNASSLTSTFSSSKISDMLTPWYSFEYLDTSTNCANITYVVKPPNIDVATAGVYLCIAHVHFKQNGNGVRELRIIQTRSDTQVGISTGTTGPASDVGDAALCESYIFTANAGDRFSLQLYQSSGGTLAATFRQLQVYRLSSTFMPAS